MGGIDVDGGLGLGFGFGRGLVEMIDGEKNRVG